MGIRFNNLILAALLVVALSAAALAQAPRLINYQGRVLNAVGAPVLDGAHNFDFEIYDMSAGGAVLWQEPGVAINTTGGLFTYQLGSPSSFNYDLFTSNLELWLEVTVDGQVQTPRTRLISNPYAETAGNLSLENPFSPGILSYKTDPNFSQLSTYGADGLEQIRLWGGGWGEIFLHDGDASNDQTAVLTANISGGGELDLRDDAGVSTINLHGGQTGNTSVEFPTSAIDDDEILNEPGIAHSFVFGNTDLTVADTVIDSIVVDVPTAGYLNVTATGYFQVTHTSGGGRKVPRVDINDSKGLAGNNFTLWVVSNLQPTDTYWNPFALSYVKVIPAGQTVIYLVADVFTGTGCEVGRTHLIAKFYPTRYGAVDASKKGAVRDGITSITGEELVPVEIYDASLELVAKLEAEREALRAENVRLRFEKDQLRETQQRVSSAAPNQNQK